MQEAHVTAYLKNLAWSAMPSRNVTGRDAQRAHVMQAVQQQPAHQRRFVANVAWARLGYGGGI